MPSRKSDVRRSDVSAVSRPIAPAHDEDSPMTAAPAETDSAGPATGPTLAPPVVPSFETPLAAESNAGTSEKGKEKDKERERDRDALGIEDLNLPKSIITRLAKGVLPPNTQIQANAILALSKSATVFISHLSNAANEWTMSGGKKTIMPADVFRALDDVEYGFMREKLEAEFAKFNEIQSSKRSAYRKKVSAAKKARTGGGEGGSVADSSVLSTGTGAGGDESMLADTTLGNTSTADAGGDGDGRAAKKAKVDAAGERMEVDGHGEVSDAETVPDEHVDEEEDDDEEEEEEDDDEDEEQDDGGPGGEDDELEEREGREVEDEALDEDSE